jgi:hypothetical protein
MCNSVLQFHVHNSLPLDLILSHFNSVHTLALHSLKIHLNIIPLYYIIVYCRVLAQDFLHFTVYKGYKPGFIVKISQSERGFNILVSFSV